MKITVSVPDELWAEANPDDSSGPSDTVQRALRLLRDQLRASRRPMANAPDQADLERYRALFDEAVESAAASVGAALDNGYRFGLLLAPGLTPVDFEVIDNREAREEIQELVREWGEEGVSGFSSDFVRHVRQVLDAYNSDEEQERRDLLREVLGTDEDEVWTGVVWEPDPDVEGQWLPRLTDTFADGVLAALRDVRDQAIRQIVPQRHHDAQGK